MLALARQRVVETLPLPAPGTIARAAARGMVGREKGPRTLTMGLVAQAPVAAPRELRARLVEDGVRLEWAGDVPKPVVGDRAAPAPPGLSGTRSGPDGRPTARRRARIRAPSAPPPSAAPPSASRPARLARKRERPRP